MSPFLASVQDLIPTLRKQGFAALSAQQLALLSDCELDKLQDLQAFWNQLPSDTYLKDGGRYRRRRHACFTVTSEQVQPVAHRAHWQPVEYNALHGGMHRLFEPVDAALTAKPVWNLLLQWLAHVANGLQGARPWFVEAHQFRIDTTDGIGRPTPEGAHRDGVDLVAVFLVQRHAIKGAETRVFQADGPNGQRFTLTEPWSVLLLDDHKVIHESTPIQPLEPGAAGGYRDTLVVTLRAGGFQGA